MSSVPMRRRFLTLSLFAQIAACASAPPPAAPPPAPPPAPALAPPAADDAFRAAPPAPGPDVVFTPPKIEEAKLANGARVLFVERHELPVVAVQIMVDRGASEGPPGVGGFLGGLLLAGTKKRPALALSDELERIGAQHAAGMTWDFTFVRGQVLSHKLGDLVDVLADVVQNPAFAEDEITRERSRRLTQLAQENDRPAAILGNTVASILYPAAHPYASSLLGTEGAIRGVNRATLTRFYAQLFAPEHATIAVAGDISRDELLPLLERAFGGWKGKKKDRVSIAEPPAKPAAAEPRVVLVDRPSSTQSNVAVALPGVPRRTKDFDALLVMNTILGGQFSSRLNMNLREKNAYSYGVRSNFDMRHGAGPFTAGGAVFREKTDAAVREMLGEIERIRTADVTEEELADAKAVLVKTLPARFETVGETVSSLAALSTYGLPLDEYATRPARLGQITRADVRRVAETALDPSRLRVVVVGDAAVVKGPLGEVGLGAPAVRAPARAAH